MKNLYRNAVKTPAAFSFWTKVVEPDSMSNQYVAGIIIDMDDKDHKAFIKELTAIENDMRKEAGKPEVKVTTALKEKNYQDSKVKVLKATTKHADKLVAVGMDNKPLKHNPWSTDKIILAITPSFNTGDLNPNHLGLKLYLNGLKIVESNMPAASSGNSQERAADLLGIELPDEIEVTGEPDTGDEFIF